MSTPQARHPPPDEVVLKMRLARETKLRLAALARRQGLTQSSFIRRLIANALVEAGSEHGRKLVSASVESLGRPHIALHLNAADRRALRARASARNVRPSRYLAALVRAHLKSDQGPLAAEMAMMRELVTQLNAIGVGLNHLVRAANEGAVWAGGIKEILEQTLSEFEKLGLRLTEFAETSRKSWQLEDGE